MSASRDALSFSLKSWPVEKRTTFRALVEGGKVAPSPNNNVTAGDYESALQGQAATLMNEAPAFSFDADDRFPGGLNVDYWQAVVEYLGGGDLDEILERMESRANEVY